MRSVVLVFLVSSNALAEPPIVGGTKTAIGDFPNVVAIAVGSGLCTGTLVAPTWVLTAGHCIDPGEVHVTDHAAVVASIRVHVHTLDVVHVPGTIYTAKDAFGAGFVNGVYGHHDLALIELTGPVDGVAPALVNLSAGKAPIGIPATMVGYGKNTVGANTPGTTGVEFVVSDRKSAPCAQVVNAPQIQPPLDDANVFCYPQADGKGKCLGDSGGPSFAMIDGVPQVIGVTSFGDNDCAIFGVDTRTDIEADFLLAHADLCSVGSDCTASDGGCCSTSHDPTGGILGLAVVGLGLRRRRR